MIFLAKIQVEFYPIESPPSEGKDAAEPGGDGDNTVSEEPKGDAAPEKGEGSGQKRKKKKEKKAQAAEPGLVLGQFLKFKNCES